MGCFMEKDNQAQQRQLWEIQHLYRIQLLFAEKPPVLSAQAVHQALQQAAGSPLRLVEGDTGLLCFSLPEVTVPDGEGGRAAVRLTLQQAHPFDPASLGPQVVGQQWTLPEAEELLAQCRYEVSFFDMMAGRLDRLRRGNLLMDGLEALLPLCPGCIAVYMRPAEKLLSAQQATLPTKRPEDRFVWRGVNVRAFRTGEGRILMDSLGLWTVGQPEVELCFPEERAPGQMIPYAYDLARHLYLYGTPQELAKLDGGTVDNPEGDGWWHCRLAESTAGPARQVLRVEP